MLRAGIRESGAEREEQDAGISVGQGSGDRDRDKAGSVDARLSRSGSAERRRSVSSP